MLRDRVGGDEHAALERQQRRDVDDRAAALLDEAASRRAREREHAVEVDVQTRSASSALTSSTGPERRPPAELTRTSSRPKAAAADWIARSQASASACSRSSSTSALRRPRASIRARVSAGSRRSRWTMSQPASASASAAVCPMPRVVPVMHATRPSRRKLSRTPGTGRGYHRARGAAALEPVTWRARALAAGGRTVADSRAALLVLYDDAPPAYAFPESDIERDALPGSAWRPVAGPPATRCSTAPRRDVARGGPAVPGHPRSPYHRIDAIASSRHVRVTLAGALAESIRPMASSRPASRRASTSRRPTFASICSSRARPSRPRRTWAPPSGSRRASAGSSTATSPGRTASRSLSCRASPACWRSGTTSCASSSDHERGAP